MTKREINRIAWDGFTHDLRDAYNECRSEESKSRFVEQLHEFTGVPSVVIRSVVRGGQCMVIDGMTLYNWFVQDVRTSGKKNRRLRK